MSRLSPKDADTLRLWLKVTSAIHATRTDVPTPARPLGWMILAHLAVQPSDSAPYAELRATFELKEPPSLTQALTPLIEAGLVISKVGGTDARERVARLTDQGFDVVGRILHPKAPTKVS